MYGYDPQKPLSTCSVAQKISKIHTRHQSDAIVPLRYWEHVMKFFCSRSSPLYLSLVRIFQMLLSYPLALPFQFGKRSATKSREI